MVIKTERRIALRMGELTLYPLALGIAVTFFVWYFWESLAATLPMALLMLFTTGIGTWVLYDCWKQRTERDSDWAARVVVGLGMLIAIPVIVGVGPFPTMGILLVFSYSGVVLGQYGYKNSWRREKRIDHYLLVSALLLCVAPLVAFLISDGFVGRGFGEDANNTTNNTTEPPPPECHAPPCHSVVPSFEIIPVFGALTLVYFVRRAWLRSRISKNGDIPGNVLERIKGKK